MISRLFFISKYLIGYVSFNVSNNKYIQTSFPMHTLGEIYTECNLCSGNLKTELLLVWFF